MTTHSLRIAGLLLGLLERDPAVGAIEEPDWDPLQRIALRNRVLLRATDRLTKSGVELPQRVAEAVRAEQARVGAMLSTVERVAELGRRYGIPFIFARGVQFLPDMGKDIDLLVGASSSDLNECLCGELGAMPLPRGLRDRIAGSWSFRVPGCPVLVDLRLGRFGPLGEHKDFAADVHRRSEPFSIGTIRIEVPRQEDQLVLHVVERAYGRPNIRLADVAALVNWARSRVLDWDEVIRMTRALGVVTGLSCYLSFVKEIHESLARPPLSWPPSVRSLLRTDCGRLRFSEHGYQLPLLAVNSRLYAHRLAADLGARRWAAAARLCLIPAVAAGVAFERIGRLLGQESRVQED